jgi:syntaxin 1B/2/3
MTVLSLIRMFAVKPDASPEEIDQVLDSDEPPQIFAQSVSTQLENATSLLCILTVETSLQLMQQQRSGQARAVLSEVQNRHVDIKKIERTILELHELFIQMNMLVENQGEMLKEIDMHAQDTVIHLEEGNKHVDKAITSAKATRKVRTWLDIWWLLLLSNTTPSPTF